MVRPDTSVRLRDIFQEALRLPGGAREAFLNSACGDDATLRAEVESLLVASEQAGAFLLAPGGRPGTSSATGRDNAPSSEAEGTTIGRYRLLRLIGEGGFGTVFLAEQEEPVRRHVALKVIKLGMDTRQMIARFHAERQALAMMDHPHIARVFDADATDSGRPYFVMELVEGVPVTDYCDGRRLSVRRRLELFIAVCDAVQHAHQKGVIHRDLKPSNILVAESGGTAVPKVIDFGIARAVNGRLTEHTLLTEERQLIGTPEYMSPEQAERGGVDVDTRSDVYGLGVLLYELLTGVAPFDPQDLRGRPIAEVERVIREVDPPRPSARVEALPRDTGVALAAGRSTEAQRLGRLLRRELDWVVTKCLEKDRSRRYQTVSALADDLRRYLADEEVLARPTSARYRVAKFVRRHKAGMAAAAGVAAALLLGVAGTGTGLVRARAARLEAEREAAAAWPAKQFMRDLLGRDGPEDDVYGVGRYVRPADVLDAESMALSREAAARPDAEMGERLRLGRSYLALGLPEEAARNLRRARDLSREAFGGEDERTLRITSRLVRALHRHKKKEAAAEARAAYDTASSEYGPAHRRTLVAACDLADTLYGWDQEQAEPLYRHVLAHARNDPAAGPVQVAALLNNLAWTQYSVGKLPAAEASAREAAGLTRGPGSGDVLPEVRGESTFLLAMACDAVGKADEAARLYEQVARQERERLRLPGTDDMRRFLDRYADFVARRGDLAGAVALRREILGEAVAYAEWWDEASPEVAQSHWDIAELLYRSGKRAAAAVEAARAVEVRRRANGTDSKTTGEWSRAASLAAALGPAESWRSEALWRHVWLAADEFLRQRAVPRAPHPDVPWDRVRLRLGRWNGPDAPGSPVVEGMLAQFRLSAPPDAGMYILTMDEAASADGPPLRIANPMLLCEWEVASYVLPDGPMKGPVWGEVNRRPSAESRKRDCLALDSRMFRPRGDGPGGRVRSFGLVATTSLRLPPGAYELSITSDDGVRLWLDDRPILEDWSNHATATSRTTVTFTDRPRRLRVEYFQSEGPYTLWLRAAPQSPGTDSSSH